MKRYEATSTVLYIAHTIFFIFCYKLPVTRYNSHTKHSFPPLSCFHFAMKLLLSLLAAILTTRQAAAQCDACFYVPEDPSDCKDYGRIGGETVAWPRASQDCLNVYQIRIAQQDVSSICSSANAFVNALRFGALQNSDA